MPTPQVIPQPTTPRHIRQLPQVAPPGRWSEDVAMNELVENWETFAWHRINADHILSAADTDLYAEIMRQCARQRDVTPGEPGNREGLRRHRESLWFNTNRITFESTSPEEVAREARVIVKMIRRDTAHLPCGWSPPF